MRRLIEVSSGQRSMPIPTLASPGPGAAGAPPAELISTVQRAKWNGIFLTVQTVAIVFLMVVKPQLGIQDAAQGRHGSGQGLCRPILRRLFAPLGRC